MRRREGGREGGVKKRKGTPLSLYYLSVTGLLGSCHGYRDSRLSVLLTIAHKGSIQLWATMQISLFLFLSLSFFLFCIPSCFSMVDTSHFVHPVCTSFLLSLCISSVYITSHRATQTPSLWSFPLPLSLYPSITTPTSKTIAEK